MKCQSFPFLAAVFALTLRWALSSSQAADETALDTASIEAITGLKGLSNQPKVYFMHIGGEGSVPKLAQGIRAIFEMEKKFERKPQYQPTPLVWDRCPPKVSLTGMRYSWRRKSHCQM
jgi:hypothetical protein